jgi:hypothetical protein
MNSFLKTIGIILLIFLALALIANPNGGGNLTSGSSVGGGAPAAATPIVANAAVTPIPVTPAVVLAQPVPAAATGIGPGITPVADQIVVVAPATPVEAGNAAEARSLPVVVPAAAPPPAAAPLAVNDSAGGYQSEPTCGYRIKAIVEPDGVRRYYRPDDPNYGAKRVNPANGDRWFCTISDAQYAGFRDAATP